MGPPKPPSPAPTEVESRRSSSAVGVSQGGQGTTSSDVFIKLALEQLQSSKEARKFITLKDAAKTALAALDTLGGNAPVDQQTLQTLFQPFQLACQSRQPQLTSIAIDCLGKLFNYNYWGKYDYEHDGGVEVGMGVGEGDDDNSTTSAPSTPKPKGSSPKNSMEKNAASRASETVRKSTEGDRISTDSHDGNGGITGLVIDTICDSFSGGENTDEKVQVQIVKALSAAVCCADPNAAIHGGILLKAIRTTYNIFLLSKSANTQIIAQATLTQMVQAVFSRVPKDLPQRNPEEGGLSRSSSQASDTSQGLANDQSSPMAKSPNVEKFRTSLDSGEPRARRSTEPPPQHRDSQETGSHLTVTSHMRASSEQPRSPDSDISTAGIHDDASSTASTYVDGGSMKGSSSIDSLSSVVMDDKDPAVAALRAIGRGSSVRDSKDIMQEHTRRFSNIDTYIKDAYLVFRALCKLSMKPIPTPEGATDLKSHSMRSKLLSLHLMHTVLSSHLHVFYTPSPVLFASGAQPGGTSFIHAIKQYLCLSLSRNAASVVPQVFDIAMEIFGRLLVGLRPVLKVAIRKELSVIFTEIIIPIIEARSTVTFHQRTSLLKSLHRILSDPQANGGRILVEMYLNYDCDVEAGARENIWERLIGALSKVMTQHHYNDPNAVQSNSNSAATQSLGSNGPIPPAITTANLTSFTREQVKELYSASGDYTELKKRGLELLVRGMLAPLVNWCNSRLANNNSNNSGGGGVSGSGGIPTSASSSNLRDEYLRKSEETEGEGLGAKSLGLVSEDAPVRAMAKQSSLAKLEDDPTAFETLKHRKQVLLEGIKRFNFKPKKGMQFLLDSGCIPSRTSMDIARFLMNTEGLNKAMIGEFLGEGDEENIAIMHAFVDEMDFTGLSFVDALRFFLQHFRLPGEAQKIDRFMLKFAERYLKGNHQSFSSADTAYVLAYSVIMLNTDQHNAQVKRRMTKQDFIKNNRGIDEGKDLPAEFLEAIFDEISTNEIVMKDEPMKMLTGDGSGTDGKDSAVPEISTRYRNKKEIAQIAIASETMALKTEAIFNTILKTKAVGKRGTVGGGAVAGSGNLANAGAQFGSYFNASHYEHVKAMFQIIWMAVLTGISGPLQDTDDGETVSIALEGFKHAARIVCLFDMDLERKAFISTLSKFTQLGNISEMRSKNLEAIRALLEIAYVEGSFLGESWKDVVLCISQLERLQLIGSGSEAEYQRIMR
ncbi:guanine nucleotide exchange protein for ADP-robosylation factor [Quaeritorhiza haematococci]|nr:guanine nucleotide exchange protein for ADP-robosylation factor [Quaeritorhiza haematococci]